MLHKYLENAHKFIFVLFDLISLSFLPSSLGCGASTSLPAHWMESGSSGRHLTWRIHGSMDPGSRIQNEPAYKKSKLTNKMTLMDTEAIAASLLGS